MTLVLLTKYRIDHKNNNSNHDIFIDNNNIENIIIQLFFNGSEIKETFTIVV